MHPNPPEGVDPERERAHYWKMGPAGAERLEVHRTRPNAVNAAVGYFALLERLHERLRPRTYVEIGVHLGRSLGRVPPGTKSIGIDPEPVIADPAVEEASKIFRVTSDDFFRDHDLRSELGGLPVDLAFIDGMHLFEFALRDFMNLERYCTARSVIMFHDCYPAKREHAEREWSDTVAWCGDVWKLIPCLREQRPDLNVAAIDVRPAGMGIITGLDPDSSVLSDSYDEIEARYRALDYDWVEAGKEERAGPHRPRLDTDRGDASAALRGGSGPHPRESRRFERSPGLPVGLCRLPRRGAVPARVGRVPQASSASSGSILYNNRSDDDGHREALAPYIEEGTVVAARVAGLPAARTSSPARPRRRRPTSTASRTTDDESRWIAFIDLDEFLFSPTGRPLPEVLSEYERWPGVGVELGDVRLVRAHRRSPPGW